MDKPRITAEELAQKLGSSRKIMRKVDTGDYEKGFIDEEIIKSLPEELAARDIPGQSPVRPVGKADPNRINQSKLPDAIKRAMIENPIPVPDISLGDSLDMNLVNKARKLMEEDGTLESKQLLSSKEVPKNATKKEPIQYESHNNDLEKLIESVIRRVLDEKLTQILTAQQMGTINENLAIKVGDSIFTGKITKVKNAK